MWSSQQTLGYICLTASYIDTNWQLHSHILNFIHVPPPHNAICICESVLECITTKWGIHLKLFSVTADNCSTNDSGISLLRRTVERKNNISFPLRGEYFHIRCGAQIINLIVKDGMNDMDDTISKVRDSVKYIRGSPKRLHAFKECVKTMGLDEKNGLNYDVPTRWNSTLIMLRDALLFKDVFQRLALCDPSYTCLPFEDEWSHASDLCQFLKVFYDATNLFSTTKQYLLGNLDKPDVIVKYGIIESTLHELSAEYKNMHEDSDTCNMGRANASTSTMIAMEEYKSVSRYGFKAYVNSVSPVVVHTDLDKYFLDPMEEISPTVEFNILSWWKANESKYKILARIARDVLAILVSTVASESAFSTLGRIINDYRCSTTPKNVESLICTQSWIGDANNLCESSHDAEHLDNEEC
ncbi:Zinc finger BED domain-containing protein RICESLEEPER 3 [Nymphaea thermarum]|nr:Zinc finger BED domain-containing protein RICESLEEPER 3 [Nymphaea thermarum]